VSRLVALSRIEDLGVRNRNAPAILPADWAGVRVNADGVRALHEALHPTLLLLAFAGFQVDDVAVARRGNDTIVLVTLSPRNGALFSWELYLGTTGVAFPTAAPFAVAVPLEARPGLTAQLVTVDATGALAPFVRTAGGRRFLVLDVPAAADLGDIANGIAAAQTPVRTELAARIAQTWAADPAGEVTTGLLAALLPDLWTFPLLPDPADFRRQTIKQLGDMVTGDGFTSAAALQAFLLEEAWVRDRANPLSVDQRLTAAVGAAAANFEQAWHTEAEDLWNRVYPNAATRPPFRRADHRRLSFSELVFDMFNEGLMTLAGYAPPTDTSAYGGFDLQRDDNDPRQQDDTWTYEGEQQSLAEPGGQKPAFIAELRGDLQAIGFGPLADGDPVARTFGAYLESAVREFQIYAAMPRVARFATPADNLPVVPNPGLVGTLIGQDNDQRYTGPISGALNVETRALLKMWVERDWHCPVVVEARALTPADRIALRNPATPGKRGIVFAHAVPVANRNLWRRLEARALGNLANLSFIAWDFTRHYPQPPGRLDDDPVVISRWHFVSWQGAAAVPPDHNWPEAEIKPDTIFGAFPNPAQRHAQAAFWSTFRVFRAIAEPESVGTLDGMNAWDSAIVSGGPWHWTLGLGKDNNGDPPPLAQQVSIYPGELGPLVSFTASRLPADYATFLGAFGIQPREPWANPPVAHWSPGQRKYRGWILLQDPAGNWVDTRNQNPATVPAGNFPAQNQEDLDLIEVLHNWHWVYRWQMLARVGNAIRPLMWDLSRARLRALLTADWGGAGGAVAGLRVEQVFTSEQAVAMLERIHVNQPEWVLGVSDRTAEWDPARANINFNINLGAAFQAAARVGGAGNDPRNWGDLQEAALINFLLNNSPAAGMNDVCNWPVPLTYNNRDHDPALLPVIAEEAPDIGGMPPLRAAPGQVTLGRFTVTDRETAPAQLLVTATSADPVRLPASVRYHQGDEFELVLEPPAGAAEGEVRITLTANDRRQVTTRELFVNVTAGNANPVGVPAAYRQPDPIFLSPKRGSFEFDATGLFAQP
jgi:hypothetical protein